MKKQQYRTIILALMCVFMLGMALTSYAQGSDDSDGDGLSDSVDRCPNVAGPRENGGCPILIVVTQVPDSDGDGLNDDVDSCPNEAGPRENGGCPTGGGDTGGDTGGNNDVPADSDGDGVPDSEDQCASEAGEPPTGCPREEPRPVPTLMPMPGDGPCVVSPLGTENVNIREYPSSVSDVIGQLPVNALAPVLDVTVYLFYAEPEFFNKLEFPVWYQIEYNGIIGWVAASVVRFGGDCADYLVPTVPGPDDVLNPDNIPDGGIAIDDVILGNLKPEDDKLIFNPYPPVDPSGHVNIDLLEGVVKVNDDEGEPIFEIIVGSGPGSQPDSGEDNGGAMPSLPGELDILYCNQSEDPITEADCIVISTAARGKADILIESLGFICLTGADGSVECKAHTAEPEGGDDCTQVAGTLFCATDYLPGENCVIDPDDGHLICTASFIRVVPLDPVSPMPGLGIFNPNGGGVLVGLLLPAVQAAR